MLLGPPVPFGSNPRGVCEGTWPMSLLMTRELLAVAVVILAVVAMMMILSVTQSRRRLRADVRGRHDPPHREHRSGR